MILISFLNFVYFIKRLKFPMIQASNLSGLKKCGRISPFFYDLD
ncbi:unknown [[Mannheimia] succiniciproducens MBEL55E]|uniref:Uncharacterized protein n=1 Tax=Mannheimia succiniciproducens (strain KCTC 0769BP / MBEL55E) TaxID=221988 RepID=Q65TE3_MANSM|nr:unknown [[Mannheimia] succiniciproducens MBEL55E]